MAKSKRLPVNKTFKTTPAATSGEKRHVSGSYPLRVHLLAVLVIAVITWICLSACLQNELGLWDDTPYIRDNWLVKSISWQGIRNIFSNPSMGNYHPLTILSYAIEYSFVQLDPWLYHFDNLLLHMGVTALVYWMVLLLSQRMIAAAITALLFALHPMHVESVAWVASRKDLLCALFFVAAVIAYIYQQQAAKRKTLLYAVVLFLFTCALLSKAVAVTFPVCLLLVDYFKGKLSWRSVITKIPLFILALIAGIIAIKVQRTAGAMSMNKETFGVIERIALGCYALITYLWKAVIPVGLHCLYSYPFKIHGALPPFYYLCPIAVIASAFLLWRFAARTRWITFGILFFLVNIALLLQWIPVGDAIIAERYSYIPYIGLFFIAGAWLSRLFETSSQYKYIALASSLLYLCGIGYAASERCLVWHDEGTLWRDETNKEPEYGAAGFSNLGYVYYTKWQAATNPAEKTVLFDSAAYCMKKAISIRPGFVNAYIALGELQRSAGKLDDARKTYFDAISANLRDGNIYFGLAILHYINKNMDSAGYYFRKVLEVQPSAEAHGNYANYLTLVGRDDSALAEYTRAISMTKEDYVPLMNRGNLYRKLGRWREAVSDYNSALKINPDAGQLYYVRSFCDTQQHNYAAAIADVEKAMSAGYKQVDAGYLNGLKNKVHR